MKTFRTAIIIAGIVVAGIASGTLALTQAQHGNTLPSIQISMAR